MRDWLRAGHDTPPQRVRTDRGVGAGDAPRGFSAALLPYLDAAGERRLVQAQAAPSGAVIDAPLTYYDQVLRLFGEGALQGRFRFDRHGELQPAWQSAGTR